ncbi:MAG: NfeD family protein [Candidatus Nitrotoga sp.]
MPTYAYWFLLALGLLAMEMLTGTFYMLILSIAVGMGGLAALLGWDMPTQIACSVITGMIGVMVVRKMKGASIAKSEDQNLDVGQTVRLITWHNDGTARVHFRGAEWDAEWAGFESGMAQPAVLYIKSVHGSKLVLTSHKPSQK